LHAITEYRSAARLAGSLLQGLTQTMAVENIIAEDQTDRISTNKLLAN